MHFTAKIIPGSPIDTLWRNHARVGGAVHGVVFRNSLDGFVSEELTDNQAVLLSDNPSVRLIATNAPIPAPPAPEEAESPIGEAPTPSVLTVGPEFRPKAPSRPLPKPAKPLAQKSSH